MNVSRLVCAFFLAVALFAVGCEMENTDPGPTPVCVSAAGVWDVHIAGEDPRLPVCADRNLVWTIYQNGCDVTIQSEAGDHANGATGGIGENRLYVEWFWSLSCYEIRESITVGVDGDTMTGEYYVVIGSSDYRNCTPGLPCSAPFTGVRRQAAFQASG